METGHPSTRAVNSGSRNRALLLVVTLANGSRGSIADISISLCDRTTSCVRYSITNDHKIFKLDKGKKQMVKGMILDSGISMSCKRDGLGSKGQVRVKLGYKK